MDKEGNTLEIGIMKLWLEHGWSVDEIRIDGNKWVVTAGYVGQEQRTVGSLVTCEECGKKINETSIHAHINDSSCLSVKKGCWKFKDVAKSAEQGASYLASTRMG